MEKTPFSEQNASPFDLFMQMRDEHIASCWGIHMRMFGPILAPAFLHDDDTRRLMCSALNSACCGMTEDAVELLEELEAYCVNDADRAACFFGIAVAYELADEEEQALVFYQKANDFHHHFHLPYLKAARAAQRKGEFDVAEQHYRAAIQCFYDLYYDKKSETFMFEEGMDRAAASVYQAFVSCLTRMHRFDEAKALLAESAELPRTNGRISAEAALYAALGDRETVQNLLEELRKKDTLLYAETKDLTEHIFSGKHPSFLSGS